TGVAAAERAQQEVDLGDRSHDVEVDERADGEQHQLDARIGPERPGELELERRWFGLTGGEQRLDPGADRVDRHERRDLAVEQRELPWERAGRQPHVDALDGALAKALLEQRA